MAKPETITLNLGAPALFILTFPTKLNSPIVRSEELSGLRKSLEGLGDRPSNPFRCTSKIWKFKKKKARGYKKSK